jgi:hypothetical protein
VVVKRGVEAGELLLQARALGLSRRGRTVRTGQRGRDTRDLLQGLTDDVVFCLHLGHATVDPSGQALEWGVRAAATVGIEVALESSTDVSQGLRQASAGRWSRPPLIVIAQATHGTPVIQPDLAGIRRWCHRRGDVLGQRVRWWWENRGTVTEATAGASATMRCRGGKTSRSMVRHPRRN